MDKFGEQRCRLCRRTVNDEEYKEIQEQDVTKDTFDFLLLKLNFDYGSKYIMCNVCFGRVTEAFRFKSMCINTNNTIIPYVDDETHCPIDLKEIYINESRKNLITLEDYKVCQLCMKLIKEEFIPAHEMAVDMMEMYIPEINLNVVPDPVICRHCFDAFVSHSNFIKNCLEINDKIDSSPHTEVVDTSIWMSIKTEEVDIKSENEQEDEWFESDSTMIYEGISNEIDPLKLEDESVTSELVLATDNVSADSRDQPYSGQLKNHKVHKVEVFQHGTRSSGCTQKSNLRRNLLITKDIACNLGTKQKSKLSETKVLECNKCDFRTKYMVSLKRHQLMHKNISEVEVFECDLCDFKTKHKGYLKYHRLTHKAISEVEAFECDTCNYKTRKVSNLKCHQLTHKDISEVDVFQCDICDYKAKRKCDLKSHQLSHKDISEMETFECDMCDFNTKNKNSLKRHQLTHKDISEVETFECDICDFKTKHKSCVKDHQLTHKDISEVDVFLCDICDYKTKRKRNLKSHQLRHKNISEVELFECDICDFKTKYKKSLKNHQLTHLNSRMLKVIIVK